MGTNDSPFSLSPHPTQPLNWKEIHTLASSLGPQLIQSKFQKLFVPHRDFLPRKFFPGEWSLLFRLHKRELALILSIQPQTPYFFLEAKKLPRSEPKAPRSAFDLEVEKLLKGRALTQIEALPMDRMVIYWFENLGLVHTLIPARPNLQLIQKDLENRSQITTLLCDFKKPQARDIPWDYQPPKPNKPVTENRFEDPGSMEAYGSLVIEALRSAQKRLDQEQTQRQIEQEIKNFRKRLLTLENSLEKINSAPPWKTYGDILKAHLYRNPKPDAQGNLTLEDPHTGEGVIIPTDPKRNLSELLGHFFEKARKLSRQKQETETQIQDIQKKIKDLQNQTHFEAEPANEKTEKAKPLEWSGFHFVSETGFQIFAGRNEKENQKLTFQIARGNDLWFHVRGKPSAHLIVQTQKGKSVDLETLLDAAHVLLAASGGKSWGKTEIDYTQRKNVQRIRGSTQVSYRGNKTLLVSFDPERWESIRKRVQ